MNSRLICIGFLSIFGCAQAASGSAAVKDPPVSLAAVLDRVSAEQVSSAMDRMGFKVVNVDTNSKDKTSSIEVTGDRNTFYLDLLDCNDDGCGHVYINAWYVLSGDALIDTVGKMNDWNSKNITQAYSFTQESTGKKGASLGLDVRFYGGNTLGGLQRATRDFDTYFNDFYDFLFPKKN